jgi:hypothetical protein
MSETLQDVDRDSGPSIDLRFLRTTRARGAGQNEIEHKDRWGGFVADSSNESSIYDAKSRAPHLPLHKYGVYVINL